MAGVTATSPTRQRGGRGMSTTMYSVAADSHTPFEENA